MDEAWRESGTWSESNLLGGLDIRSAKAEELDVVNNNSKLI